MRARCSMLIALGLVLGLVAIPTVAFASGARVMAQGTSDDEETQGEEPGGSGQSDPEAETGSEESETGEAEVEAGPPWTYQMGRMALALTVLLGLAIIRMYYKLVVNRQKGTA